MENQENKKNNQDITVETYEKMAQNYIERTPNKVEGIFKEYIDDFLSRVSKDADILEIGSATGRDADYIEEQGYHVHRTDITEAFIEYQKSLGKTVDKFDAISDDLEKQFDLVVATAVFLHFNKVQFTMALDNTKRHLKDGGVFAFAVKQGDGEEFTTGKMDASRYFLYWKPEDLEKELVIHGFEVEKIKSTPDNKWIHCVATIEKNG